MEGRRVSIRRLQSTIELHSMMQVRTMQDKMNHRMDWDDSLSLLRAYLSLIWIRMLAVRWTRSPVWLFEWVHRGEFELGEMNHAQDSIHYLGTRFSLTPNLGVQDLLLLVRWFDRRRTYPTKLAFQGQVHIPMADHHRQPNRMRGILLVWEVLFEFLEVQQVACQDA